MEHSIIHLQNQLSLIKQTYTIELLAFMETALLSQEAAANKLQRDRVYILYEEARSANYRTMQEIENLLQLPTGELSIVEKAT
jgi:hypothetical protein